MAEYAEALMMAADLRIVGKGRLKSKDRGPGTSQGSVLIEGLARCLGDDAQFPPLESDGT
jgi:uncharacterized membrane protein